MNRWKDGGNRGVSAGNGAMMGMHEDGGISRRGFLGVAGLGLAGVAGALSGCGGTTNSQGGSAGSAVSGSGEAGKKAAKADPVEVRVSSLKGPTTIGLVDFMDKASNEKTAGDYTNTYAFTMSTAADEILPQLIKGGVDIALIPANAASVVYNKTKGKVTCLDINTLGVLSVVTGDTSVTKFADLAGRTVYLTGKGTTPEYVMNYLLDAAGIADSVNLEFKSEAAEVVSVLAADPQAVGVLPQPFVTAAQVKNTALAAPVDLTEVWERLAGDTGSQLLTGVTVARAAFVDENPDAVDEFMREQAASVDAVNADPATAAKLVVAAGIVEAEPVAAKAIPACHITCIEGSQMHDALEGYLDVLYNADASSVGGAMPGDDFYYQA